MPKIASDARICATRIRRTLSHLHRKLRAHQSIHGLSVAQLSVVGQIHRLKSVTPTELAQREGVKIQTLTRLLAELQADGWVERVPDALDRRQSWLSLSPHGRRRLAGAAKTGDASLAQVIQRHLDPQERALLLAACELLDRLDGAIEVEAFEAAENKRRAP
ncbi:MAG: MarR family transcriptional regulator [Burkholderiaceae bacterium]|jgi:DNA-binding MarR family transcriptional regulator